VPSLKGRGGGGQNQRMDGQGADELQPGLYDTVLSQALVARIAKLDARRLRAQLDDVEPAELPERMAEVIGGWAREVVAAVPVAERPDAALALAAGVLDALAFGPGLEDEAGLRLLPPLQRLVAIEALAPTDETIEIQRR
jgi:hypothetical protein